MKPNKNPTHLSLFSGIGGLDLAAEWAGFQTVGQCEWADYPTKVLEKHWPDVPRWKDIKTLTGKDFYERTGLRTVDIISGGFPCQPFSVAGKRRGKDDDRFIWPEMVRVIKEIKPTWIVGENVAGIIGMGIDSVLSDLENEGYATWTLLLPACGVGAPHQRYRVAIMAHADSDGCSQSQARESNHDEERDNSPQKQSRDAKLYAAVTGGEALSYACGKRLEKQEGKPPGRSSGSDTYGTECGSWWKTEPGICRMVDGVPHWVDRIRCLGNAVVPQQFYPIFRTIFGLIN